MRKIMALLLVFVFLLTVCIPVTGSNSALASTTKAEQVISALGIMTTDQGSISTTTQKITRGQYAQLLYQMSASKNNAVVTSNVTLFGDVPKNYWAAGYIKTAVSNGWMTGYMNGTFKPKQGITLLEAVSGILKLLGYSDSDFAGNASGNKMALYTTKELNKNVTVSQKSSNLSYSNCVNLFYNVLNAKMKDGKVYAQVLGYTLGTDGTLDYLTLVNSDTKGPLIADDQWKNELPFGITSATFYKNGVKCSYNDIHEYDVLYYSTGFRTVWAYDEKVTGSISSINPDYIAPVSVTLQGKTYNIGTSDCAVKFSSMGEIKTGDTVTLLLGKDGTVVDVLRLDELNVTVSGLILSTGKHLTENAAGNYVNTDYVTFIDASGNKYDQDYDTNTILFQTGDVIRIDFAQGKAAISKVEVDRGVLDGLTFAADARTLGDIVLTSNVKILDIKDNQSIQVYPERLSGVRLSKYNIYYYELNDRGELTQLILSNVTGDMGTYGVFTGLSFNNGSDKVNYNYILGGKPGSITTNSLGYLITKAGPMGFVFENTVLTGSYELYKVPVTSIGKTSVQNNDIKYLLADTYDVYCLVDGTYVATTIDKISDLTRYTVTAYYDRDKSVGGRIRILIATSNQ